MLLIGANILAVCFFKKKTVKESVIAQPRRPLPEIIDEIEHYYEISL